MSVFDDVDDTVEAEAVDLSDNVAEDFIEYFRGNAIGHEEEASLLFAATLTGWVADPNTHVNVLGMGPPGSGKSLSKNEVAALFDSGLTYEKTDASSNAILDSLQWDLAMVAPMDEYDKIDDDIVEVLKSSNPEDGGYSKDRNVEDDDAKGGYSPTEVSADAIPWTLLYAPTSRKGGVDPELKDRALVLYFSNDKHTRRAIGRKEFGHDHIESTKHDTEYMYDTHERAAALREHIRSLPTDSIYETVDDEEQLVGREGATHVWRPPWVWYAVEPIFDLDEDYTNRVYGIVNDLIEAWALANHDQRASRPIEVYPDEDAAETVTREAVVVAPQDVANVLSCLPTLLSTTHQLTPLKRHLLEAVDQTTPITDGDGTTVTDVQDWLDENDIPHPSRTTLKERMDELAENYYLQRWESAGGGRGSADIYEKRDQGALKPPRIYDLQRYADRDGETLGTDPAVDIDPETPFEDCTDPIRDQPFTDTVETFEAEFSGESANTSAESFMGAGDDADGATVGDGVTPSATDDADTEATAGTQSALSTVDDDGMDGPALPRIDPSDTDDGEVAPQDPTEAYVLEAVADTHGEVFGDGNEALHYMGVLDTNVSAPQADLTGTVADPDHDLWQDRPDHRDDRVISEADALVEVHDACSRLMDRGYIAEDDDGGPPGLFALRVVDLG